MRSQLFGRRQAKWAYSINSQAIENGDSKGKTAGKSRVRRQCSFRPPGIRAARTASSPSLTTSPTSNRSSAGLILFMIFISSPRSRVAPLRSESTPGFLNGESFPFLIRSAKASDDPSKRATNSQCDRLRALILLCLAQREQMTSITKAGPIKQCRSC